MKSVMRSVGLGVLLGIGLTLSACQQSPTARQGVFGVVTAYDGALKSAIAYAGLPRCAPAGPVVCSKPEVVVQLAKANAQALPSVNALTSVAKDTKQSDSAVQVALTAAQAAVGAFSQTVITLTGGTGK